VTLSLDKPYEMKGVGVEVSNATRQELARSKAEYGVVISKALTPSMKQYNLEGIIITKVDNKKVDSIEDVRDIMEQKSEDESIL